MQTHSTKIDHMCVSVCVCVCVCERERERERESFAAAATGSEETCCVVVEFGTLVSSSIAKEGS